MLYVLKTIMYAVVDLGFPVGGGRGSPTWALFGENVCKNERIGSHRGACARHAPSQIRQWYATEHNRRYHVFVETLSVDQ